MLHGRCKTERAAYCVLHGRCQTERAAYCVLHGRCQTERCNITYCVLHGRCQTERCNITKVGLEVSVLFNCASCKLSEQVRLVSIDYYRSVSIFTHYYCYLLLSTATLVTLVTHVVSKVSRPSRQVPAVRFQSNFNFPIRFH